MMAAAAAITVFGELPASRAASARRHLARFAAEDVEHADPVARGRDIGERVDPEVICESLDALFEH
jgi:hypothetical protein